MIRKNHYEVMRDLQLNSMEIDSPVELAGAIAGSSVIGPQ